MHVLGHLHCQSALAQACCQEWACPAPRCNQARVHNEVTAAQWMLRWQPGSACWDKVEVAQHMPWESHQQILPNLGTFQVVSECWDTAEAQHVAQSVGMKQEVQGTYKQLGSLFVSCLYTHPWAIVTVPRATVRKGREKLELNSMVLVGPFPL